MSIEKLSTNASLKEVMDKFEELNLQDFSSLDIVVKPKLPSEAKNGQYVIIDSDTNLKVTSSYFEGDEGATGIFVSLSKTKTNNSVDVVSKHVTLKNYISFVRKTVNSDKVYLESYLGVNGQWLQITGTGFFRFKDGQYQNASLFGSTKTNRGTIEITSDGYLHTFIKENVNNNPEYNVILNTTGFDITNYSKLIFDMKELNSDGTLTLGICKDTAYTPTYIGSLLFKNRSLTDTLVSLDVSNITGEVYIRSSSSSTSQGGYNGVKFKSIYFI